MPSTTSTTMTAEVLLTTSATKATLPVAPTIFSTRPASVETTSNTTHLKTTRPSKTNLMENTTRPSRLEAILEIHTSVSNKANLLATPTTNRTTFLETLFSFTSKTTLLDPPSSVTTTTMKPTTTIKATTNPMTTPVTNNLTNLKISPQSVTTVAPLIIIVQTAASTTVPATTMIERVTSTPMTEGKSTEEMKVSPMETIITTTLSTQDTENIKIIDKPTPTTTELAKSTTFKNNFTISTNSTTEVLKQAEQTTRRMLTDSKYNRTEVPIVPKNYIKELHIPVYITTETKFKVETLRTIEPKTITFTNLNDDSVTTTPILTATEAPPKVETTKRPQSTIRYFPTTVKFKPKEIWIRPAQKGESFMKTKTEANQDLHSKLRVTQPNTTPKTIIVSIIPTSVSYATFKNIALTTSSFISQKTNTATVSPNGTADQEVTKSMSTLITTTTESPITTKLSNVTHKFLITSKLNKTKETSKLQSSKSEPHSNRTTITLSTFYTSRELSNNKTVFKNGTNSMKTVDLINLSSSNFLTTPSTNATRTTLRPNITLETTTVKPFVAKLDKVTRPIKLVTVKPRNVTIITVSGKNKNETVVKITKTIANDVEKTNATRTNDIIYTNQVTTESPDDEEFHILTEPEHITAVMEGKGKENTSVDLISVISIAGGIMMAVITVAVIIVMLERCKRPRYDDVRKVSDIRMQVMIDNNDVPPPYVRSIFHTPLPGKFSSLSISRADAVQTNVD